MRDKRGVTPCEKRDKAHFGHHSGADRRSGFQTIEDLHCHRNAPCQWNEQPALSDAAQDQKHLYDRDHRIVALGVGLCGRQLLIDPAPAFHTDKGVVIDLRAAMCAKHTSPSSPAASRWIFR